MEKLYVRRRKAVLDIIERLSFIREFCTEHSADTGADLIKDLIDFLTEQGEVISSFNDEDPIQDVLHKGKFFCDIFGELKNKFLIFVFFSKVEETRGDEVVILFEELETLVYEYMRCYAPFYIYQQSLN
ncbi:MAG: hypothetical protein KDD50_16710, partial [Bdellovibrionales bacterium]|nr:hypothetical protein [Bdellovibrionales bacterium]